jgi:UDP-N-acetylmuramyl pentapeptide phosphotransferase/UDP-N-acetylglucosamine-1-phosphate transferase
MVGFGTLESNLLFVASAMIAAMSIPWFARLRDIDKASALAGPQDIHHERTSRLGGVSVVIGYVAALAIAIAWKLVPLRPAVPLLLAALPVFAIGLWEDIFHTVSPRNRLAAAVASAMLASAIANGVVPRVDLPYVDDWLGFLPFALPLTWFMVAGACNAFNVIDGNHGLAGGTGLVLFVGIAIVAWYAGDIAVFSSALAMAGALAGFLIWNYPRGKIFLGDAGAYVTGFFYAQFSIQLIARNPGVSAWFAIALGAYPIVEMLFSIYRRKIVRHAAAMQPDLLHLHSLLYVCVLAFVQRPRSADRRHGIWTRPYPGIERRRSIRRANARVAPLLWLHATVCLANALYFSAHGPALIGFTCLYAFAYVLCYVSALRFKRRSDEVAKASPALVDAPTASPSEATERAEAI